MNIFDEKESSTILQQLSLCENQFLIQGKYLINNDPKIKMYVCR